MGIPYRVHQFWRSISTRTDPPGLEQALGLLSTEQRTVFNQLQPGEKEHAVNIFHRLLEQGESEPDLLVAALLHDAGKLRYRMNPLERALVVFIKAVLPRLAERWGGWPTQGWDDLPGWRKAFILAEHHATWGAELAKEAGVSPLTEYLIREHHHPYEQDVDSPETKLLHKLWRVDNAS